MQLAGALAVVVVSMDMLGAHASAAQPTVTLSAGPYADGESVTVSGGGFPAPDGDPSGIVVIECADPGGTAANLPVDATTCDGATENPLPIVTSASGSFSSPYTLSALNGEHGAANINCDATDFCVLWVGVDYNDAFTSGAHAFSKPFEISGAAAPPPASAVTTTTTTPVAPVSAAASATDTPVVTPTPGTGSDGALANTGPSALLPVLGGLGLTLMLAGSLGRRLLLRRPS